MLLMGTCALVTIVGEDMEMKEAGSVVGALLGALCCFRLWRSPYLHLVAIVMFLVGVAVAMMNTMAKGH